MTRETCRSSSEVRDEAKMAEEGGQHNAGVNSSKSRTNSHRKLGRAMAVIAIQSASGYWLLLASD